MGIGPPAAPPAAPAAKGAVGCRARQTQLIDCQGEARRCRAGGAGTHRAEQQARRPDRKTSQGAFVKCRGHVCPLPPPWSHPHLCRHVSQAQLRQLSAAHLGGRGVPPPYARINGGPQRICCAAVVAAIVAAGVPRGRQAREHADVEGRHCGGDGGRHLCPSHAGTAQDVPRQKLLHAPVFKLHQAARAHAQLGGKQEDVALVLRRWQCAFSARVLTRRVCGAAWSHVQLPEALAGQGCGQPCARFRWL